MNQERILDISWGTIAKFLIAGLVLYVIFLIKDILVWVLFGVIISILFDPLIDLLARLRIPRAVSAVGIYLIFFGIIALLIYETAPFFVNEIQRFSQLIPQYFQTISPSLRGLGIEAFSDVQSFIDTLSGRIDKLASNVLNTVFAIFGGLYATIFVLSIAIFLSLEEKSIERAISIIFPKRYETFALDLWKRSQQKVSAWFFSRIVSSILVGIATYVSLFLFQVPYLFSLSLFSGVLNFIPIVGPLFTGFLIALIVGLDNQLKAVFVVLAFILIQQIEGNILTPLLLRKFIGLSPVIVLIALAIGGELWGIMGAILAIPLAGILFEFLRDFLKKRKEESVVL